MLLHNKPCQDYYAYLGLVDEVFPATALYHVVISMILPDSTSRDGYTYIP